MRELAIHAANEGFNDTTQLAADQAEIDNAISTIDRIASNTQFGTKKLLDGTRDNIATITSGNASLLTIKESGMTTGTHSVVATQTAESSATLNSTALGISLQTGGTVYNLADGLHNIDVLQDSAGATRTTTTINMTDAWNNNLVLADTATMATIESTAVAIPAVAGDVGDYTVVLDYQEVGDNPVGQQSLTISVELGDTATEVTISVELGDTATEVAAKWAAAIDANTSLKGKLTAASVAGDGTGGVIQFQAVNKGAGYSIKFISESTNTVSSDMFTWGSSRSVRGASQDTISMTITTANRSGVTKVVNIVSATSTKEFTSLAALVTDFNTALNNAFGSVGSDGSVHNVLATAVGTDKIKLVTADEGSDYKLKVNSVGALPENAENILGLAVADTIDRPGTDALISFDGYTSSITSVKYNATQDITIYNKAVGAYGRGSIDLTVNTAANGINVGDLLLDVSAAKYSVRLDGGPATEVTAGVDTVVWNSSRTESVKVNYDLTSAGGSETISNTDSSLVFQIGANVGQTAKVSISNMESTWLGKNLAGNSFTSLSKIDVTTVIGAQDSQSVIDAAITEVSTLRGKLGSFQKNTLESNLRNLRISAQNLTASESAIRDTDMASEMSNFVRYQILLQAGTAMLAQANQVPQVVLSLFR